MATLFSEYTNPYIESIYDQKKQAAVDALTSAYQQNMANYDAQAKQTSKTYGDQRSQAQAQYERALRNYDEYSVAGGLNSGAKAQARLAYGAQNQSGLSALSEGEASALQEIARNRTAAQNQYNADIAANEGAYDTDRYNALYAAWQDQLSQDNADRSYYNTLAMNTIQTGTIPDATTLAKAGIDAVTAQTMADYYKAVRETEDRDYYYTMAMNAIQTGNVPDANTLSKAGIDAATASSMAAYYRGGLTSASSSGKSSSGSSMASGVAPEGVLEDAFPVEEEVVLVGVKEPDVGVVSASVAPTYSSYLLGPSGGTGAYYAINSYISSGKLDAANSALRMYANVLTPSQYNQLLSKINAASKTGSSSSATTKTTSSATNSGGGNKLTTSSIMTR